MIKVGVDKYTIGCGILDGHPTFNDMYAKNAELIDHFDVGETEAKSCFFAVWDHRDWPFLMVDQRYDQYLSNNPAALIVLETDLLFIGAGERLLAYRLNPPTRLWEDKSDLGFWSWKRHGAYIVMSAELELAAWDINANKRWSTFVEPPWSYSVADGIVHLDVMGKKSSFDLAVGPDPNRRLF